MYAFIQASTKRTSEIPQVRRTGYLPADSHFLVLLSVHHSPCNLGWTLALLEQGLALLIQEEVLLAIHSHVQDAPPRVDPETAEAACSCFEHHGCSSSADAAPTLALEGGRYSNFGGGDLRVSHPLGLLNIYSCSCHRLRRR